MIKTIVSILFVSYQSALANRLLLQAAPPEVVIPPEIPVAPANPVEPPVGQPPVVEPQPSNPTPPVEPPANPPATGTPPANQPPVVEIPPVTPAVPSVPSMPANPPPNPPANPPATGTPPATPPQSPLVPIPPAGPGLVSPPQFPWQSPGFIAAHKLECKITPPAPGTCANDIKTVVNPPDNYEVIASAVGSCFGCTINVDLTPQGYPIERLKGFWFTSEFAGMGATITVNNQRPEPIRIDDFKCDKYMACANMRIVLYNAYIQQGDMDCNPNVAACDGCTINGIACYNYM